MFLIIFTGTACDMGQEYCWLMAHRQHSAYINIKMWLAQRWENELGAFRKGWTHA